MVLKSFVWWGCGVCLVHKSKTWSPSPGVHSTFPQAINTGWQTDRANTQDTGRWSMHSGIWLHRGHVYWYGKPRLANLLDIQHLWRRARRVKNLHLKGARQSQIIVAARSCWRPTNWDAYGELTVKLREESHAQRTTCYYSQLYACLATLNAHHHQNLILLASQMLQYVAHTVWS